MHGGLAGFTELSALGAGGFGRVVLARHDASGTVVAIKYLYDQYLADDQVRAQFRHEAAVLQRVANPYVARLYEFVETPAGAAIVMEAVPGVPLGKILTEDGALTPEAALAVLKGSLLGLAAAHQAGTVHRDYKPGNVLVQPNRQSKLVDFGIAVLAGQAGDSAGTPNYMAPEQWRGGPAAPATDVYAATCVFYRCVTGRPPYTAGEGAGLRELHERAPVPIDALPEQLRGLVAHGMAKDPLQRPASAAAFVAELEAAAAAGYGPNWESRGWERLAGQAATLLALTPLATLAATATVAGTGGMVGSAVAGAGTGAAGTATGATMAGGAATAGVGATAGTGAAATTTAAVLTKIAIGILAAAAVATTAVVVINSTGDSGPPSGPGISAAVQTRAQTFTGPDFAFNGQVVHVSGIADKSLSDKVNGELAAPIDQWIDYTRTGLQAGGFTVPPGHPVATSKATITGQNQELVSVRYDLEIADAGDAFGNHGGFTVEAVTIDLTTGKELTPADVFPAAAASPDGTAALDSLLTLHSPQGFCPGEETITRQPLTSAQVAGEQGQPTAVQVLFGTDSVQFLVYGPAFGYAMACEHQVVTVPLTDATPLMAPQVAALAAGTGPARGASTKLVAFGRFTLTVPVGWERVSTAMGDTYLRASTHCGAVAVQSCPGVLVSDNTNPQGTAYELGKPFSREPGERACYPAGSDGQVTGAQLLRRELRPIGRKKADYEEWRLTCSGATPAQYIQRVWYLPTSKIVFVDEWNTPGFDQILAAATWP